MRSPDRVPPAIGWLLSIALACLLASPAHAVGLTLAPTTQPGGILFTVGLDATTSLNGYDVTIAWDPAEIVFVAAAELSGLGFDSAPGGVVSAGERVAAFELAAVTTDQLFSVSFDLLPGLTSDGLADFRVFVGPANGSGLIPGAIADPGGVGFDVVPEPHSFGLLGLGLLALARPGRRKGR